MSAVEWFDPRASVVSFGLPDRPPAELDRVLDATERCLARHGVRRATMSGIAKEMGVSRPTLYKQLGSVEEGIALIVARQLYTFLDQVPPLFAQGAGPQTFIDLAVSAVTFTRAHPVVERLLTYEPEVLGDFATSARAASFIEQLVDVVAPLVQAAMDSGVIRSGDPRLMVELMMRVCGSLVFAPTGDLERLVRYALEPHLVPAPGESAE